MDFHKSIEQRATNKLLYKYGKAIKDDFAAQKLVVNHLGPFLKIKY